MTYAMTMSPFEHNVSIDDEKVLITPNHAAASLTSGQDKSSTTEPSVQRFSCCIMWSPIPVLTWFLPFIGHMGITDSKGVIFDFAGPYTIGRDDFAFGAATRYLQCRVEPKYTDKWDQAVAVGCQIYKERMHNLFCDNCHSHVAVCLEHANYAGRQQWNMVELCFWMFFRGKYVSLAGFVKSWLPFTILLVLIAVAQST
ncbi:Uncharacterized conserved protein [Plasmopara halstedii]|uniref:Uncharacterized conserved protein n=1 Tax=Plasmopara halstedii TaxID=4781 RepID=A0A0P1AWS5_PLAHL|nr:Uncharacterized conserved protein [Plasmopara halstedii]CEG46471.1 Uncharacterized conserved protein [Plasmopara halstedii]|eukprot:XP_024582840.1 Uncharacterized conserved protein [Plasmopara halstedii]